MTLAATKTKAEQGLSESFEAVAAKLPGGRAVADARKAAIGAFATLGLPHRRIEEWKYTDLRSALRESLPPSIGDAADATAAEINRALEDLATVDAHRLVFVNGVHRPELSAHAALAGVQTGTLAAALAKSSERAGEGLVRASVPGHEAVIALNTAFMTDGAVIHIAAGAKVDTPILLVFACAGPQARLTTTRNIIKVDAGAEATVIEAYVSLEGAAAGQTNALCDVAVGEGAKFTHIKSTHAGAAASHIAIWMAALAEEAIYRAFQLTAATGLARNNVFATFAGERAKVDISGCFLGRKSEHIDTTIVVDHAVPLGESRELFKGVLADRARSIFQGKVIVRPDAQKTDGKQMAQALMLSEDAEFDSKPELEIHADDVVCGHGSTVAEIDADTLFYLMSRGIPRAEARGMLIESFVAEAIEKVESEPLREALGAIARTRLATLTG